VRTALITAATAIIRTNRRVAVPPSRAVTPGNQVAINSVRGPRDNGAISHKRSRTEEEYMNTDVMEGKWKQMRGQMKEWWGKLTDDDFDTIAGKKDKLVGKLQERYGWAKRDAEEEVSRRFGDTDTTTSPSPPAGTPRP
jgi:uncharacterized protein YjbJ (UPF0337 family)